MVHHAVEPPREVERNRLLRRADWRFLLPHPRPAKTVCWDGGLLARSVATISDRVVDSRMASGDGDLAVLVNPNRAKLASAWAALRNGGACYSEWYSPFVGGAPGVQRRLEAAGFTDVSCYWPWTPPDLASPSFWLPLQAPQALDYFLSTRPRLTSVPRRAWNAMLRILWRWGMRAHLVVPVCAVARKPTDTPSEGQGGNADLSQVIRTQWQSWGLGSAPHRLDLLLLTGGQSSLNKIVGLVFADSERTPRIAVKFPRVPASIPGLEREAANLQMVQSSHRHEIRGVPRNLFFQNIAGAPVLGETVLMGQPLYTVLRPGTFDALARQVTDWLADLWEDKSICPRVEWWDRIAGQALDDFERAFGPVLDPIKLKETRRILDTLGDMSLVCEQRDCSPWNVLIAHDGTLIVLDWESAEPRGLPSLDLHYFLTHCAFFLADTMTSLHARDTYRRALDPATPAGRVMFESERRYFDRFGLDPALLHPLRLLTWLIHSRSEYKQLTAGSAGPPDPAALRRSRFVNLWEEALAHAMASH